MEAGFTLPPALNARVSIEWESGSWYEGTVNGHRTVLSDRNLPRAEFHVLYDDGEKHWHHIEEWNVHEAKHQINGRRIMLRCCLSLQPLLDPGKSGACAHPACCNFQQLRDYAARTNACPVQGCAARIGRSRDVVRDNALRDAIERLQAERESLPEYAWWSEATETLRFATASSLQGRGGGYQTSATRATARANSAPAEVEAIALDESDGESESMVAERPAVATEAEGLRLHLSAHNKSGYTGVYHAARSGTYAARYIRGNPNIRGNVTNLGAFDTAIDAAVAYARFAEAQGIEPPSDPSASMSAAAAADVCPLCELTTDDETVVSWLQCDECFVWCHTACAGVDDASCPQIASFLCPMCRGACSGTGVQRVVDSAVCGPDEGKQCCVQHKIKEMQVQVTTLQQDNLKLHREHAAQAEVHAMVAQEGQTRRAEKVVTELEAHSDARQVSARASLLASLEAFRAAEQQLLADLCAAETALRCV